MQGVHFEILPTDLLQKYAAEFDGALIQKFDSLTDSTLSANTFSFYTSVSAVFSSKIEGEDIALDSYLKHRMLGIKFLPDYTRKIDDLYEGYTFAQRGQLNHENVSRAHEIITRHILQKERRGKTRNTLMYVTTPEGKIEYVACAPVKVSGELEKLYRDIEQLLKAELTFEETFFFAALLHLIFVKIHPFDDGNGRAARLLEKWFLAAKLGEKAWYLPSEKFYYDHHAGYYANIRLLGLEYDLLDYNNALLFLQMLPGALTLSE